MTDILCLKDSLSSCRSCKSRALEVYSSRKNFPLYIWPLEKTENTPLNDINVFICSDCGYLQLQDMNEETISQIYRDKAFNIENFEQKIERLELLQKRDKKKFKDSKCLEIGGGRNPFLKTLSKDAEKWVADFSIDEEVKSEVDGVFIGDFSDIKINQNDFDYIFLFHALEHFNNPSSAIEKAKNLLTKNGSIIIEVPNFEYESKYRPDYTIFHMHISLFTLTSLKAFMKRHGFSCQNAYKNDEVILAEFNISVPTRAENHFEQSLKFLKDNDLNIKKCANALENIINKISDEKIAIFGGGGATTLFLYNHSFLMEKISCALDNDDSKEGRFLCNGKIPIIKPSNLKTMEIKHIIFLDKSHIKHINEKSINFINVGSFYES